VYTLAKICQTAQLRFVHFTIHNFTSIINKYPEIIPAITFSFFASEAGELLK
jgi:hypothetical protein